MNGAVDGGAFVEPPSLSLNWDVHPQFRAVEQGYRRRLQKERGIYPSRVGVAMLELVMIIDILCTT